MRSNIRWLIVIARMLFQIALAKLTRARRGLYLIVLTGGALLGLALLGGFIQPWQQHVSGLVVLVSSSAPQVARK